MEPIAIHLREEADIPRKGEPVQLGIPLPKGALFADQASLYLSKQSSSTGLPFQHSVTAVWPDHSVRWLLLSFLADIEARQTETLILQSARPETQPNWPEATIDTQADGEITVSTGVALFRFKPGEPSWLKTFPDSVNGSDNDSVVEHILRCKDSGGADCTAHSDTGWQVVDHGPLSVSLELSGDWIGTAGKRLAQFRCRLQFWAGCQNAKLEFCIHNPQRARHPGGLWDLGDPGSIHFRALGLDIALSSAETAWIQAEADGPQLETPVLQPFKLYQDSSGGEAWDSCNHLGASGKPIPRFRGYELAWPGTPNTQGLRAQPFSGLRGSEHQVEAYLQHFWQNFPSSLEHRDGTLHVGLFPEDVAEPYELQGGERKTQTVWLNYGRDKGGLDWVREPLCPTLKPEVYEKAEAFHWFAADAAEGPLERLIQEGLDGPNNFFAKREVIDEYGWRNFGDLFADHETLYQHPDEKPLISHYNNQYDAIYGFARQFARTGDKRWFELMDDLAGHVKDIDIYHTLQDRAEYNNGLFWHTDHYLPAHTATHRTFSRHNSTSSTPGQTGGGPAAEHCYTTGLLYHYYLTGSDSSRQAVLDLAEWIKNIHEGQGGFLEQLLALKKQDLPNIRALIRGEAITPYTYPFTRGTGNYINTLLDASQLEPDKAWLSLAESVIRQTLHPTDDISKRNLLDVETGWSYLVLLNSIIRYLGIKIQFDEIDEHYSFARLSVLHYADWMLHNERPFLESAEQLEFPNDTWKAQEIRKAMLLYQAATTVGPDRAKIYKKQAEDWLEQVSSSLQTSPEKHFTRIQVILLQNYGPHQSELDKFPQHTAPVIGLAQFELTWFSLFVRILSRLTRGLSNFSPSKEHAWLMARLDRR